MEAKLTEDEQRYRHNFFRLYDTVAAIQEEFRQAENYIVADRLRQILEDPTLFLDARGTIQRRESRAVEVCVDEFLRIYPEAKRAVLNDAARRALKTVSGQPAPSDAASDR